MGRHDADAMQAPKLFEAFKHFVKIEEELLHLLELRFDQDRKVLIEVSKGRCLILDEGKQGNEVKVCKLKSDISRRDPIWFRRDLRKSPTVWT